MSNSLGLIDSANGLVNSVLNLLNGQVREVLGKSKLLKNCNQCLFLYIYYFFWRLVEMTFWLVNTSTCSYMYSLPKWQVVELTFFTLCCSHTPFPTQHFILGAGWACSSLNLKIQICQNLIIFSVIGVCYTKLRVTKMSLRFVLENHVPSTCVACDYYFVSLRRHSLYILCQKIVRRFLIVVFCH